MCSVAYQMVSKMLFRGYKERIQVDNKDDTRDWFCVRCSATARILTSFLTTRRVKLCESCNALCCFDKTHYTQSSEFTFQVCVFCSASICCKCNVVPDWCRTCYNREVWFAFTREIHVYLQRHLLSDLCTYVTEYLFLNRYPQYRYQQHHQSSGDTTCTHSF